MFTVHDDSRTPKALSRARGGVSSAPAPRCQEKPQTANIPSRKNRLAITQSTPSLFYCERDFLRSVPGSYGVKMLCY